MVLPGRLTRPRSWLKPSVSRLKSKLSETVLCDSCGKLKVADRLQLVVTYSDHQIMYFPISADQGWRVSTEHRQIVIGRGVPRTMIPLDSVLYYSIEKI